VGLVQTSKWKRGDLLRSRKIRLWGEKERVLWGEKGYGVTLGGEKQRDTGKNGG